MNTQRRKESTLKPTQIEMRLMNKAWAWWLTATMEFSEIVVAGLEVGGARVLPWSSASIAGFTAASLLREGLLEWLVWGGSVLVSEVAVKVAVRSPPEIKVFHDILNFFDGVTRRHFMTLEKGCKHLISSRL